MKHEVMEKWTAALESGEYKRTRSVLKKGEKSFCCLGVLCDVYHKETGLGQWNKEGGQIYFDDGVEDSSDSHLPAAVKDWAGMNSVVGMSRSEPLVEFRRKDTYHGGMYSDEQYELIEINDNSEKTFKEIAAIIRKNVDNL